MEGLFCIGVAVFGFWLLGKIFSGEEETDQASRTVNVTITPPPLPMTDHQDDLRVEEVAQDLPRTFSLYLDARTARGRFDGTYHGFSTSRLARKLPTVVTGLTFQGDRLHVLFGQGTTTFPFEPSLTVSVVDRSPAGFREHSEFGMVLTNEAQGATAEFPLSFAGWLEVIDMARQGGAAIEMDEDLPERLKNLIGEPLPGDESFDPVSIRPSASSINPPTVRTKCSSCGANMGGRPYCEYCGDSQ